MKQNENEVIQKILGIFEASDLEEEKDFKVWSVMLIKDENYLKSKVCFLEKDDKKSFYPEMAFRQDSSFIDLRKLNKVRETMKEFDNAKITVEMISSISKFFDERLKDSFVTRSAPNNYIIIKLKSKVAK